MPERLREQVIRLRQRAAHATAAEVEQAVNDVYAALLAAEATRTRISRRLQESVARALEPGGAERVRDHAESLRTLDGDVDDLSRLLDELRSLPVEPARPVA